MIATLYVSTAAFSHVSLTPWFISLGAFGMVLSLACAFPELRTTRARLVLAAVLLALIASVGMDAQAVGDPCRQVSGILYWLIGCGF